ncbi:MAG: UvrD-helicase domain-containing protein [Planctomycetes bacterium]|nr:UvrD-helicase domain-containing protein [Planctomycetota bacterium]
MRSPTKDLEIRLAAMFGEENVAVTAGAGTGKTTLLVDTVLVKLLALDIDVGRMLMLTFTDKAAAEMRERLEDRLKALLIPASKEDEEARAWWREKAGPELDERLRAALAGLDRAEISTIHGFCAHILREYPIEAGIEPRFTIDQGPRFDDLFEREWERWLDAELGLHAPRPDVWRRVLAGVDLEELREIAEGLSRFRIPEEILDPARILEKGQRRLDRLTEELTARLRTLAARQPGPNGLKDQLHAVSQVLEGKAPAGDVPLRVSTAKKGWEPGDYERAQEAMAEALPLARDIVSMDERLLREAIGLACDFAGSFRARMTREGLVGFDGLLMRVRDLLASEDFPEVRDRLKAKYRFLVVDEFQDTDPVQCEVILFLAETAESHAARARDVRLARGKLFIVGDPKQSIYSFRGADIVAYKRLKEQILAQGGTELFLKTNFRSHSGIIRAVNGLFERIIREAGDLQPPYVAIEAHEDRAPVLASQKVEAILFEGPKEGDRVRELSSEEARRAEAETIASWIRKNVGALQVPEGIGTRPLRPGDIAILLRAMSDVVLLVEELHQCGLPYVVEGAKYYYGTQEVIDFVNLLRAIANPFDRIALAGLLRSPLGAVDDATLLELARAGALDYRMANPPEAVATFYRSLNELHGRAARVPVPELLDEIFERLPLLELAGRSFHRERAVANLLKMRRLAEASLEGAGTLRAFLVRLRRDIHERTEEGESPLADEALDAVRVMSVHKAKGLEFPVVFLPDLHRYPRGRDDEAVRYDWPEELLGIRGRTLVDPGGAALGLLWKRRVGEESRRVLYVALTRARERLVMTASASAPARSPMGELLAAMPDPQALGIEVRRCVWKEPLPGRRPPVEPEDGVADIDWSALDEVWMKREREFTEIQERTRFVSPSRLQERADPVRRDATDLGTLCHLVMQRLDFANPDVGPLVASCAKELGMDGAETAREILDRFVRSEAFDFLARSEIVARELPFLLPDGERVVQGVVDLVARIGQRWTVVDYKTDREEHPERYAEQKKYYLRAVETLLGARDADFRLLYLRTGRFVAPP